MAVAYKSILGRFFGIDQSNGDLVGKDGVPVVRAPDNRVVTLAVSTTITRDLHDGKTIMMDGEGSARTFTLPAATGSGAKFKFMVKDVNTSNYLIKVASSSDTMQGTVQVLGDDAAALGGFTAGATADTITLNGTTTGGVAEGDWVELLDAEANKWFVTGILTASGAEATPFSATV
jgi:hypothetical protein